MTNVRTIDDLKRFYWACNPAATLDYTKPEDRRYYIDFSEVRSGNLIRELKRTISFSGDPTCQLFSGHIGCGKSTELLRLKAELEDEGDHVVYFVSSEDLDMGDVDITDILFAIIRKIIESLADLGIRIEAVYLEKLFDDVNALLKTEIDFSGLELSAKFKKITSKAKDSPSARSLIRDRLESRTDNIISAINDEVLMPAAEDLKEIGKSGLVVLVDNLDRIHNIEKTTKRTQPEYIFFDRGEQLKALNCHLVYTIPLSLIFSNDANVLTNRFGVRPKVLSMVPVQRRNGRPHEKGVELLKQMVMVRAFPDLPTSEHMSLVEAVFDRDGMLDRLCWISGGHVRNLLSFLSSCFQKADTPFPSDVLEEVVREARDDMRRTISKDELQQVRDVVKNKDLAGKAQHSTLLHSMFVFEYQDPDDGMWFDANPLFKDYFGIE